MDALGPLQLPCGDSGALLGLGCDNFIGDSLAYALLSVQNLPEDTVPLTRKFN